MAKARKLLVLVEAGTPAGFRIILEARKNLPGLIAPCPQPGDCPLAANPETKWCHFSKRLERSRMAALLKGGELGYEDEKFCYAVFSRTAADLVPFRVIGYPNKKTEGKASLELCGPLGIEIRTFGRNEKSLFKKAKKAEWGDSWQ
jgi:ribosomal protein RSM22 (predicted rRNA methylase)